MPAFIDRTGEVHGYLTVVRLLEKRLGRPFWLCRCKCGIEVIVASGNLSGNTTSCGCKKVEACLSRATHNLSKTPEYKIWKKMRERCSNPNCEMYKHYGGRGITICKRWDKFENFLKDMGNRPSNKHSLERKKVNQGYKPSNCCWILKAKQNRNRRDTIRLTYKGITKTLIEWSEELGIPYHRIKRRYYLGWATNRILGYLVV